MSAVKDNSMRAGIEDDLDRGVPALISTTKLCQNVGKECKVKIASQNSLALAVKKHEMEASRITLRWAGLKV